MALKRNLIANYVGQGWAAVMGVLFIPVYIHQLGIGAWGLVAFVSTLQAWLLLLDLGLTPTISREMARYTGGQHTPASILGLLRAFETVYLGIALLVCIGVAVAAGWIAEWWLGDDGLPKAHVLAALQISGVLLAGRLLEQSYRGALRGLQRQVWLNVVDAALATLRWGGAALLVSFLPKVEAFFAWHAGISILSVAVLYHKTHRLLAISGKQKSHADFRLLWSIRHISGGMAMITLLALLLTQVDKLLLSKLLTLDEYGVYMLAASVAGGLSFLVMPTTLAVSPRLAELVARGDEGGVAQLYHKASQWVAAIIVPCAMMLALFSSEILSAWTGNPALAAQAAPILSLLALGTMFNAFMHVPYQAQLAYGWTSLAVKTNMVAVVLLLPAIAILVPRYGAIASAWIWCILNAGYVLLPIHFMYRRLLTREKAAWYWHAVINPLLIATLLLSLVKAFLLPLILIPLAQIGAIAVTAAVCGMAICLVSPALRPTLVAFVRKWQPAAQ